MFDAITAIATSISAGILVFEFWKKASAQPSCLTITGRSYYHKKGSDSAQLRFVLKSNKRIRINAFSIKNVKVSLHLNGPFVDSQDFGLSLDENSRDYQLEFFVKPYPKNAEAVCLTLDIGRKFSILNPTYTFYPNDFSSSGIPDLGQWPVDH